MWARDIAEILNPPSDHDWRLLSTRLGYTNDDIRNWATQANPCLSMFDEWFATHKTREATFGITCCEKGNYIQNHPEELITLANSTSD